MSQPNKNPLMLLKPMVRYFTDDAPITKAVIRRLERQGYIKTETSVDRFELVQRSVFSMTGKGHANRERAVLPGWEQYNLQVQTSNFLNH